MNEQLVTYRDTAAETRELLRLNPGWARRRHEDPRRRRPITAKERVEAYLQQCATQHARQKAEDQALRKILQQIEVALAVLTPRKHLVDAINQARKDATAGRCCDLADVGGHSHSTHRTVRLRAAWDRFSAGS